MHEAHDALICIGNKTYVNDKTRIKFSDQHYFKTNSEMSTLFADLPEALENNYNFPFRCNFRPLFSNPILPNISSEKGGNVDDILKKDSQHGLKIKFDKVFGIKRQINKELIAEIAYHSEVIEQGGSGGKMDQYSIAIGNTTFLETGSKFSYKEIDSGINSFIIANSGVSKNTDGVLNLLKNKALDAISKIQKINSKFNIAQCKKDEIKKKLKKNLITLS